MGSYYKSHMYNTEGSVVDTIMMLTLKYTLIAFSLTNCNNMTNTSYTLVIKYRAVPIPIIMILVSVLILMILVSDKLT